jgi:drug/metabolite transporter (DMT)-like permease
MKRTGRVNVGRTADDPSWPGYRRYVEVRSRPNCATRSCVVSVGGIVPALCLGLGTMLMRSSIAAGASIPSYLAVIGTTIALIGWISMAITGQVGGVGTFGAIGWAVAMALTWSTAIACISYGFGVLKLPVAVVAPLTNANALVAVTVGALAFGEWRSIMTVGGTLLICAGVTLVSLSR